MCLVSALLHFLPYIALASNKGNEKWLPIRKTDGMVDKMHTSGQNRKCIYEEMEEAHQFLLNELDRGVLL